MKRQRTGFTLIELLVVVAIIALLIAILIPSLSRAKELANRSACGANLSGIGKAMTLYAAENGDTFPCVVNPGTAGKWGVTLAGTPNTIPNTADAGTNYSSADLAVIHTYSAGQQAGDPMANLWMMVLKGGLGTKMFICRSDSASPGAAATTSGASLYYNNFDNTKIQYSYGVAYPWDTNKALSGMWKNPLDASLPILSDVGTEFAGTRNQSDTTNYKNANSLNHSNGEGQNVGYSDAHVEFTKNPLAGQAGDNIYTVAGAAAPNPAATTANVPGNMQIGTGPVAPTTLTTGYDTVMVPVRTSTGTSWK